MANGHAAVHAGRHLQPAIQRALAVFFSPEKKKKNHQVRVKPWEDGDFTTKNQI